MMNLKSVSAMSAILLAGTLALAAENPMKPDNQAVNSACATDATTAGCGGEVVGKGLLKCLHAYKKEHKEFKFSADCKAAMKTRHAHKAASK